MAKHEIFTVLDKPQALDRTLVGAQGRRSAVLDFWRFGRRWVFKLSVPKDGAVSA